jgi:hypothetical protein
MPSLKSKWWPVQDKFEADKALAPQLSARDLEAVFGDFVNGCYGAGGIRILKNRGRPWVFMLDPLEGLNFTFRVRANSATELYVNKGYVEYADNGPEAKGDLTLEVTASGFVYISLDLLTGVWGEVEYAEALPAQDENTSVWCIAEVTVNSLPEITDILPRHLGDIYESKV